MTTRFSRLFDDWDHDQNISMIDIGDSVLSPHSDRASIRTEHNLPAVSPAQSQQTLPPYDDQSTRSLLRKTSEATTNDYESSQSPGGGEVEAPRQRSAVGANMKRLFHRRSLLSARTQSTFDGNFAHGRPGWWDKQMLVDRSLRSMAAFTAVCAVIMLIILFSYLPAFAKRINHNSTSVGGKDGEHCSTAESRNVATHLFINIAATMILGCSNTYQQLVTSLKVDEIRWVLSKRGDSKVGTNSPWAINHKKSGKGKAWFCWWLLIFTSIPVHFLANSVIGPSFYISMPTAITYAEMDSPFSSTDYYLNHGASSGYTSTDDSACWTALRANSYVLPKKLEDLATAYHTSTLGNSTTYAQVDVRYTSNCTAFRNTSDIQTALTERNVTTGIYYKDNCYLGTSVVCVLSDPELKQCRMNVRMQAAFILAGCLIIKAAYMIFINFRARQRTKHHCLTFGDVIVASVLDPDIKIQNECLLNSGDGYRHKVEHTCHKHCKDPTPSRKGDEIGHCQKCKKFNIIDMAADLAHPSIAIKYKRSLLSNLGSTAITQMLILMLTSFAMIGISIMIIVGMSSTTHDFHTACKPPIASYYQDECDLGLSRTLKDSYGTWGGFSSSATLTSLPSDSLGSEFMAFAISNGAQFLYSLLYLLLIYNLTLVSMEHEWGKWERERKRPRCTLVSGRPFEQSYFLQLPSRMLIPLMFFAALMHWLLGQAISTVETIYTDPENGIEHSIYFVTYAAYPIFISTLLMIAMTVVCWWAFTYTREGFIPQMYGSIRACCASTSELEDFGDQGILWGDLGMGEKFRHAGFSSDEPGPIVPAELYCGKDK